MIDGRHILHPVTAVPASAIGTEDVADIPPRLMGWLVLLANIAGFLAISVLSGVF